MEFEWDEHKARTNLRKHRVDFADAATVFEDARAITLSDADPDEERYATIGTDALGRLLVVVYTVRGEHIRIISAELSPRAAPCGASARITRIRVYEAQI